MPLPFSPKPFQNPSSPIPSKQNTLSFSHGDPIPDGCHGQPSLRTLEALALRRIHGLLSVSGSATEVGANDMRMCQAGSLQHQVPLLGAAATRPHSPLCGIFSRWWSFILSWSYFFLSFWHSSLRSLAFSKWSWCPVCWFGDDNVVVVIDHVTTCPCVDLLMFRRLTGTREHLTIVTFAIFEVVDY